MKAIIEKPLMNCEPESMNLFVKILNEITSCITEDELRGCMNSLCVIYPYLKLYFKYGFGHNHMWVKESDSMETLIFVEF
jgi:hypothetical protein|uniref:Uncharacterized protein n=1 Tax=Myoviridae sp. ctP6q2 TaxID=2825096 RepID=A0A8S5UUK1_9CAUD|nr:MAG TPA: hypothetical protein [Myoviridae sp. ctP6q2]